MIDWIINWWRIWWWGVDPRAGPDGPEELIRNDSRAPEKGPNTVSVWTVFNNGLDGQHGEILGTLIAPSGKRFGFLPLKACRDIAAEINKSIPVVLLALASLSLTGCHTLFCVAAMSVTSPNSVVGGLREANNPNNWGGQWDHDPCNKQPSRQRYEEKHP